MKTLVAALACVLAFAPTASAGPSTCVDFDDDSHICCVGHTDGGVTCCYWSAGDHFEGCVTEHATAGVPPAEDEAAFGLESPSDFMTPRDGGPSCVAADSLS